MVEMLSSSRPTCADTVKCAACDGLPCHHEHSVPGCTTTTIANGGHPNCATCTGASATTVECLTCDAGYGYFATDKTCVSKYQIQTCDVAYGYFCTYKVPVSKCQVKICICFNAWG